MRAIRLYVCVWVAIRPSAFGEKADQADRPETIGDGRADLMGLIAEWKAGTTI